MRHLHHSLDSQRMKPNNFNCFVQIEKIFYTCLSHPQSIKITLNAPGVGQCQKEINKIAKCNLFRISYLIVVYAMKIHASFVVNDNHIHCMLNVCCFEMWQKRNSNENHPIY